MAEGQWFTNKLMMVLMAGLFGRLFGGGMGGSEQAEPVDVVNNGVVASNVLDNSFKDLADKVHKAKSFNFGAIKSLTGLSGEATSRGLSGEIAFLTLGIEAHSDGKIKNPFGDAKTAEQVYTKFPQAVKPAGAYAPGDVFFITNKNGKLDPASVKSVEGNTVTLDYTEPGGGKLPQVHQNKKFTFTVVEEGGKKVATLTSVDDPKIVFKNDKSINVDLVLQTTNPEGYKAIKDKIAPTAPTPAKTPDGQQNAQVQQDQVPTVNDKGVVKLDVKIPIWGEGVTLSANQQKTKPTDVRAVEADANLYEVKGRV